MTGAQALHGGDGGAVAPTGVPISSAARRTIPFAGAIDQPPARRGVQGAAGAVLLDQLPGGVEVRRGLQGDHLDAGQGPLGEARKGAGRRDLDQRR